MTRNTHLLIVIDLRTKKFNFHAFIFGKNSSSQHQGIASTRPDKLSHQWITSLENTFGRLTALLCQELIYLINKGSSREDRFHNFLTLNSSYKANQQVRSHQEITILKVLHVASGNRPQAAVYAFFIILQKCHFCTFFRSLFDLYCWLTHRVLICSR